MLNSCYTRGVLYHPIHLSRLVSTLESLEWVVQIEVVQLGLVQLGVVQLDYLQMWVDPSAPVILKGKLRMLDGSPAFPSCTVSKATGTTCKLRNRDLIIIMRAILWALWCQGGPTLHIIMYRAPENCFRATMAILGHVGPFCTFLRYTH